MPITESKKLWPDDKVSFKPVWAPLCNYRWVNSILNPWLIHSRGGIPAEKGMPIPTMMFKYTWIYAFIQVGTYVYRYRHIYGAIYRVSTSWFICSLPHSVDTYSLSTCFVLDTMLGTMLGTADATGKTPDLMELTFSWEKPNNKPVNE